MHILVMQHVSREGSGAIGDAVRARGIEERVVRIHLGEPVPQDLAGAGGLLVMGGPMGVYEADRYPHLRDEVDGMALEFPADLAEANLSRDDVVAVADARTRELSPIAARTFGAWADRILATSR